jgi:hypothetical protein
MTAYSARQVRQNLAIGGWDVNRIADEHLGPAATPVSVTSAEPAVGIRGHRLTASR